MKSLKIAMKKEAVNKASYFLGETPKEECIIVKDSRAQELNIQRYYTILSQDPPLSLPISRRDWLCRE